MCKSFNDFRMGHCVIPDTLTGSMVILMTGFKSISQNAGGIRGAVTAAMVLPALATSIMIVAGALRIIAKLDRKIRANPRLTGAKFK